MMRTIIIGDVHGCLDELEELLEKLVVSSEDRVIFLGDLINKGPNSAGVLKLVYERGFESVVGNHDLKYQINFSDHEKYQKIFDAISTEVHQWYMRLPYYIEEDDFIVVHAGWSDVRVREDLDFMTKVREMCGKPWHSFYTGKKRIIYGHWAQQGYLRTHNTLCLDTGCVYGNELTAYILETDTLVSVRARRIYEAIE